MTTPDLVYYNSLEQLLSTDLNRIGALYGKATLDALLAQQAGIASATPPHDVVRRGLDASAGAGLTIDISAGEAMLFDAARTGSDQSLYTIGRLDSADSVVLSAADPTNPRVDLIYATISAPTSDGTSRNQITLATRVVTAVSLDKSQRPTITLGVVTGTPAANPSLPATPAGAIPLWYYYLGASETAIVEAQLLDARRRMHPHALAYRHRRELGLYASTSSNNIVEIELVAGHGWVDGAEVSLPGNVVYTGGTILPSGSGTISADTQYHVYLVALGMGPTAPVGKSVTYGFVPVLVNGIDPDPDGRPSSPITYRPLYGTGIDSFTLTTENALYVGSAWGGASSGTFQPGGAGIPLNPDGTSSLAVDLDGRISSAGPQRIARAPSITWASASGVTISAPVVFLRGVPCWYAASYTADFATNLASGESETADTWYYVYLRKRFADSLYGRARAIKPIISASPPDSYGRINTPETGFDAEDYVCVGTFYNDSGSDILQFRRDGSLVLWTNDVLILFASAAVPTSVAAVTAIVPVTTRTALIAVRGKLTATGAAAEGAAATATIRHETGLTTGIAGQYSLEAVCIDAIAISTYGGLGSVPVSLDGSNQFEHVASGPAASSGRSAPSTSSTFTHQIEQRGYYEDLEQIPV